MKNTRSVAIRIKVSDIKLSLNADVVSFINLVLANLLIVFFSRHCTHFSSNLMPNNLGMEHFHQLRSNALLYLTVDTYAQRWFLFCLSCSLCYTHMHLRASIANSWAALCCCLGLS